jgi:anti-sigma factor RsiW
MTDCTCHRELEPYHDGELSPDRRDALRDHVETCGDCSRELRQLRDLSDLLTPQDSRDMTDAELDRLHAGVSEMLEDATPATLAFPWVKALCAAAASIVVIAAAWMAQPQTPRVAIDPTPNSVQDWQKFAMGQQVQTLPGGADQPGLADSAFAQYLLDNLQPSEIHENN